MLVSTELAARPFAAQGSDAIQVNNLFMTCASIPWDGTTVTFTNMKITYPQATQVAGNVLYTGNVGFIPADGDAMGWDGETGFQLRRNVQALTDFGIAAAGTRSPVQSQQSEPSSTLTRE